MLETVILYSNEMVMAFDDAGQQIPHLQGRLTAALRKQILSEATDLTQFFRGDWETKTETCITSRQFEFHHDNQTTGINDRMARVIPVD